MENWIDENGKKVEIVPFFSQLYIDDISRELSSKYHIHCDPKKNRTIG